MPVERFTKAECKNSKPPKLQTTLTKTLTILPAFAVLVHPENCGFSAQIAKLWSVRNALNFLFNSSKCVEFHAHFLLFLKYFITIITHCCA